MSVTPHHSQGQTDDLAQADLRRVARCAQQLDTARDQLREAILRAHASGETYRDIAKAARMSHQRIWQLAKEGEDTE